MRAKPRTALICALLVGCSSAPTTTPTPAAPNATATATVGAETATAATATGTPQTTTPTASATALATASASLAPSGSAASPSTSPPSVTGTVRVIAGGGTATPANGLAATTVSLMRPTDAAFAPDSTVWIVDGNAGLLLHVQADGTLADVTAGMVNPSGVTVAPDGTVYIGERGNYRVDAYDSESGLSVLGGDEHFPGSSGDGGPVGQALFSQPSDVVTDGLGNLFINDLFGERIRMVDVNTNVIDTVAGNGIAGFSGDGGAAKDAQISAPLAIAVDKAGTQLLIADTRNQRLRRVDLATGMIATIGGTGAAAGRYDPTLTAESVALARLSALALDEAGNIYVPVFWGDKGLTIERMDASGQLTLVAGGGADPSAPSPLDVALLDVLCLATNPVTGDLLYCSPNGVVYSISFGSTAGP